MAVLVSILEGPDGGAVFITPYPTSACKQTFTVPEGKLWQVSAIQFSGKRANDDMDGSVYIVFDDGDTDLTGIFPRSSMSWPRPGLYTIDITGDDLLSPGEHSMTISTVGASGGWCEYWTGNPYEGGRGYGQSITDPYPMIGSGCDLYCSIIGNELDTTILTNPSPEDEAEGVDFSSPSFSWDSSVEFDYYKIYVNGALKKITPDTAFTLDIGDMPTSVITWLVEGWYTGAETASTSATWSFDPRPTPAESPYPADEATGIASNLDRLEWQFEDFNSDTVNVYFGVSPSLTKIKEDQDANILSVGRDVFGTIGPNKYAWRVDSKNHYGTTVGDVWTFEVEGYIHTSPPDPPNKATTPYPANGATGVSLNILGTTWVSGD